MKKETPLVSVILTTYNAQAYIKLAIDSILSQTFEDFELIVVDDGSTDKTAAIIKSYKDPRVRYSYHSNRGVPKSSNAGIKLARGIYIARHDADDISTPHRFEKQVQFLNSHPNVDLVGSNYIAIDSKGAHIWRTNVFTSPKDLKIAQVFMNQFGHGSIMVRKDIFIRSGKYNERGVTAQDYHLINRISRCSKVANLEEPLYMWRSHRKSITQQKAESQRKEAARVKKAAQEHFIRNRKQYPCFRFSITSFIKAPKSYIKRKAILFYNLSILLHRSGYRIQSAVAAVLSAICEPTTEKRRLLSTIAFEPTQVTRLEYTDF